jgi:hypothetical protein
MPSLLPDTAKYDLALQLRACQSSSRRNGKVARLPAAMRDQINHLMDDAVPYKVVIEKLGPAGQHLNEDNLSNWRLGGYQDYLKAQAINDRARIQTEAAADIVRDSGHLDPRQLKQACSEIALLQYIDTLYEHGEQLARDALMKNPAKMITLMNACCNMSNTNIAIENCRLATLTPPPVRPGRPNPASVGPGCLNPPPPVLPAQAAPTCAPQPSQPDRQTPSLAAPPPVSVEPGLPHADATSPTPPS